MKKKGLLIGVLLLIMVFNMTGCVFNKTKGTVKNNDDSDKIDLYSDDKKVVFKNGDSNLVFYYKGTRITGYHVYVDYKSEENAKKALEILEKNEKISKVYTKDKYLVIEYNESEFKNMSVSDVKRAYEYLKEATK